MKTVKILELMCEYQKQKRFSFFSGYSHLFSSNSDREIWNIFFQLNIIFKQASKLINDIYF